MPMGKLHIKWPPLAISALALSILGLANLVKVNFPIIGGLLYCLAGLILITIFLKFILAKAITREELQSPIVASSFVTFFMAGETFIGGVTLPTPFKQTLWAVFSLIFILYYLYFTHRFTLKRQLSLVYPSWFVVYVGIATISISGNALGFRVIAWATFLLALTGYFILLLIITHRIFKVRLTAFESPTLAIYAAPPSLLLATYLTISDKPSLAITAILLGFAQISYLVFLKTLVKLRKQDFSPLFLSLTFPSVIAVTALRLVTNKVLTEIILLKVLTQFEFYLSVIVVTLIAVKIVKFTFTK